MAATVDHLGVDRRVAVLKAFSDARGHSIEAGTQAVIRAIDIDFVAMEIHLGWEREDGVAETLVFPIRASAGPRNGAMREYFEVIEEVAAPRPPPSPPPSDPPPEPRDAPPETLQPVASRSRLEDMPGDREVCLDERTVACACDPRLHRRILPAGGELGVHACLGCGVVTATRQVGDDGRHTGNAWTAYWTAPTPRSVIDWLGQFPRVDIDYGGGPWCWPRAAELVRYPTLFYPADLRVADADELARVENELRAEQAPLTRAQVQRIACGGVSEPPGALPEAFTGYAWLQLAAGLSPQADLARLRALAHLRNPACEIAADLLLQRPDARAILLDWLASPSDDAFSAGVAMLRDATHLKSDDLARTVLGLLDALPLGPLRDVPGRVESCARFEAFLTAIADLKLDPPAMRDGLAALRRKLARHDSYLVEAIGIVLREFDGLDNRPTWLRDKPDPA